MPHGTRILSLACFVFAIVAASSSALLAQVAVSPTPPPQVDGPSLEDTLVFVQEKLNDIGSVTVSVAAQISTSRYDFNYSVINTVSNATADSGGCRVSYHSKIETQADANRATEFEGDASFNLRDVKNVAVKPFWQFRNEKYVADGSPQTVVHSTHPDVAMLVVSRPHGETNAFPFTDFDLAERMVRAINHAVGLCGGKKDPF